MLNKVFPGYIQSQSISVPGSDKTRFLLQNREIIQKQKDRLVVGSGRGRMGLDMKESGAVLGMGW
jgi:hypothetical protein